MNTRSTPSARKDFRRDTSTMARNVSRLEERKLADKRLRNLCDDLVTRLRSG